MECRHKIYWETQKQAGVESTGGILVCPWCEMIRLREERDEAEARVEELESRAIEYQAEIGGFEKANRGLGVQVEELKKDKARSIELLARWFHARNREGWEKTETEERVIEDVVCLIANTLEPHWPSGYDRDETIKCLRAALDAAGGE